MTTASGVDVLTVVMMVMGGILGGFIGYRIRRGRPQGAPQPKPFQPYEPKIWLDGFHEIRKVEERLRHEEWIKTHPQEWEEIV
jgi:hypothetical protein